MIVQKAISIQTQGRGCIEITPQIASFLSESGIEMGLCNIFIQHTSASLIICENADPSVLTDLETFTSKVVPDGDPMFIHTAEGSDDMPAHIRSVLTHSSLTIPIISAELGLGTWQGIFLWEHRIRRHRRNLIFTIWY